jgi:hypothetical protein
VEKSDLASKKPSCNELVIPQVDGDFCNFATFSHLIQGASQHKQGCLDCRIARYHRYTHDILALDGSETCLEQVWFPILTSRICLLLNLHYIYLTQEKVICFHGFSNCFSLFMVVLGIKL